MKNLKITLGPLCDGVLSIGDTRECHILLNGESIGDLTIHADHMTHYGRSTCGDRYSASSVSVTIWPRDFGIDGFEATNNLGKVVEYIEHDVDIYDGNEKVRTAAQAKREARQWVAEMVYTLKNSVKVTPVSSGTGVQ